MSKRQPRFVIVWNVTGEFLCGMPGGRGEVWTRNRRKAREMTLFQAGKIVDRWWYSGGTTIVSADGAGL